jgi:perosamine synthetase
MSNIQAALGLAQLERLEMFIQKKRAIGHRYTELFKGATALQLPVMSTDYAENIYWVYGLLLNKSVPFDAIEARKRLAAEKIQTRHFFWPMHKQPVFNKRGLFLNETYPVAENLAERGFYLPSGLALTNDQIESVVESVHKVIIQQ